MRFEWHSGPECQNDMTLAVINGDSLKQKSREAAANMSLNTPDNDAFSEEEKRTVENGAGHFEIWPM